MGTVKIGIASLLGPGEVGSVALPEGITFFCPRCGTEAADKGECLVSLNKIPDEAAASKNRMGLALEVDCRACSYNGRTVHVNI